ncbi:MAG: ABC transporter permease, partial [Prevotellaceae bacterium]|nr:ABC transporter permease [Prevotellaceae bacterium]
IYVKLIFSAGIETLDIKVADNTQWVGKNIAGSNIFRFENIEPVPLEILREKYADSESVILYIEGEKDEYPVNYSMYSKKAVNVDLHEYVRNAVASIVENRKLKEYNIDNLDKILAEIRTTIDMPTVKWEKSGEDRKSDTYAIMGISYVLSLILYMFIFMFGAMVMRGVIEEKSNRIIEIMISSVKPFQLMAGKIVGIALVAILQFLIWVVLTSVFFGIFQNFSSGDGAGVVSGLTAGFAGINIIEILAFFILYFIGGYLLYASMFAAIGSAVDSEADSQQLMMPITIPLILAIMIMVQTFRYPDSSLSVWASMIPFTSPIIMVARIPFGVPLWQIALSLTILFATCVLISYITAKIYRVGILMYGKKPSFREIFKWLKYK